MLATNVSNYIRLENGEKFQKCELLYFSEMIARNVNTYKIQKYWRYFFFQVCVLEMLTIHASSYEFKKSWRQMLAIIISRNVDDRY